MRGALFWVLALRRLNDWVPQVRSAARATLPVLAQEAEAKDVADAMWLTLRHWRSWERIGDEEVATVLEILSHEDVALFLKRALIERTTGSAGLILAEIGRASVFDPWYRELAFFAVQPAVRRVAFRAILEKRARWLRGYRWTWTQKQWGIGRRDALFSERALSVDLPLDESLDRALRDASSTVRQVAGDFVVRHRHALGDRLPELAATLASDRNRSVRRQGTYLVNFLEEQQETPR